ncbi:MAG: LETM1-related biofilm-associated protein [Flavobacteriales bacterium]
MLVPGSKGWINKYFDLVDTEQIKLVVDVPYGIERDRFIHAALGRTGIIYGFPSRLHFAKELDDSKWTTEEKLKLLLFESQLLVYLLNQDGKPFEKEEFIAFLVDFYGQHNASSITKLFSFFLKETKEEKIESILTKRVDIRVNFLENSFWVNYLNNVFIYLDVILFNDFLEHHKKSAFYNYDEMAMNALAAITMASYSDGMVEDAERSMFKVFLASANLSDLHREIAENRFENGTGFEDFTDHVKTNLLLKRFILDLSAFVIFSNHDAALEEKDFLNKLCLFLDLTEKELNEALALTEQFIINNQEKIPFLRNISSVERVYSSLSKRWIKILGRNRDKLATELKQSKELVYLIRKSTTQDLSKEEKELVKEQFKDIVKSMPSLAIFMLPGGAFLLPLVLKVIPDLVPSAFRDNEVEK